MRNSHTKLAAAHLPTAHLPLEGDVMRNSHTKLAAAHLPLEGDVMRSSHTKLAAAHLPICPLPICLLEVMP